MANDLVTKELHSLYEAAHSLKKVESRFSQLSHDTLVLTKVSGAVMYSLRALRKAMWHLEEVQRLTIEELEEIEEEIKKKPEQ